MTASFENEPAFAEDPPRTPGEAGDMSGDMDRADALLLKLDGYDGPIDVLLDLARDQKLDLTQISILQLARQFLAFIDRAAALKLELAAEYLVMAAWLAYLKSRLLIPRPKEQDDEPDAEDMAAALAYQLRRLESMQVAARALVTRPQMGTDFFVRGFIEPQARETKIIFTADLYTLLKAYGDIRARALRGKSYELPAFHLMPMDEALQRVARMLGKLPSHGPYTAWTTLLSLIPQEKMDPLYHRSSVASVLTAALEMAKQGMAEIRQDGTFKPIYLRGRQGEAAA